MQHTQQCLRTWQCNNEQVVMNGSISGTAENTHSLYFNTALCMQARKWNSGKEINRYCRVSYETRMHCSKKRLISALDHHVLYNISTLHLHCFLFAVTASNRSSLYQPEQSVSVRHHVPGLGIWFHTIIIKVNHSDVNWKHFSKKSTNTKCKFYVEILKASLRVVDRQV